MPEQWTRGGHLSGDTPVSEMPFPEVLTRPALGMPAPGPQDAAPRVPTLACPKCGEPDTTMTWCAGGYSLAWGQCVSDPDHFHRGCPRCHYTVGYPRRAGRSMSEAPEYRYAVSARTEDGPEAAVTFGSAEGALTYAEYWTGPRPWWKRAWRRVRRYGSND